MQHILNKQGPLQYYSALLGSGGDSMHYWKAFPHLRRKYHLAVSLQQAKHFRMTLSGLFGDIMGSRSEKRLNMAPCGTEDQKKNLFSFTSLHFGWQQCPDRHLKTPFVLWVVFHSRTVAPEYIWCLRLAFLAEAGMWNCHSGIQGVFIRSVPAATSASFPSSPFWEDDMFLKLLHHLTCSLLEIPFTGKVLESCITIVLQSIDNETGRKDVYCSFKKHLRITGSDLRKIPNTPKVNSWYYYMSKQNIIFL